MKAKLCVAAGIGGCLLLMAYFKPYVLFSSDPAEQSRKDLTKSQGLLNYEKSNIPGLEVKTPAKIAIVNKIAVAKLKKAPKKERQLPAKPIQSDEPLVASRENDHSSRKIKEKELPSTTYLAENSGSDDDFGEDGVQSDINPYVASNNANKPGSASAFLFPVQPKSSFRW